ncbi:MAG TPA: hypothetical protein VGN82_07925 [Bosea sp. (in: a-proteobacteria)]|jgi:hypothetical protein|uniref:hypothetical protein n=1 Tax=Bosea sp. (in: a-proteobacteria) TaxID=1871050 RepID=UPI002E120B82|nr:hypothetical protein [Bosea sp. (in: a-proteobacteria)]
MIIKPVVSVAASALLYEVGAQGAGEACSRRVAGCSVVSRLDAETPDRKPKRVEPGPDLS